MDYNELSQKELIAKAELWDLIVRKYEENIKNSDAGYVYFINISKYTNGKITDKYNKKIVNLEKFLIERLIE